MQAGMPMRVALFSRNARNADAIGAQVVAKITYFQQLGAEVRLYLSEAEMMRAEAAALKPVVSTAQRIWRETSERDYLLSCDLIVAEYGAAYDLMHLLPALSGKGPRIVVDYRGVTPVELGDVGLQSELAVAAEQRALLWCADAVLVQSQFAASEVHQATGLPRERIHQIPCWIVPASEDEAGQVEKLRHRHGLIDTKIVLFVGRLAANKQPERVIQALPHLASDVHAVFIGCQIDAYRERLQECRQLAHQLSVSERVHFIGSVSESELEGWYRDADVLCLPSRHECFGMPIIEAMQRGIPVVGSDAGSLPEVIGHAGVTAGVDDEHELAQQLDRLLSTEQATSTKRIALVTHRFGTQFAGGAEKSLRLMAMALQSQGYVVEVFTTCNEHESHWANTLPSGTSVEAGFTVHRFAIDSYDANKLGQAYEVIRRAEGVVSDDVEQQYLQNSLGSKQLIEALSKRRSEFAAILTGPYLFKLVHEVAKKLSEQVLLAPCFHDEPLARLDAFKKTYRQVGGLLFHTDTEARFTATQLAINHPRHQVVGTKIDETAFTGDAQRGHGHTRSQQYLVYCGRYCPEKGVDRLLQYMEELNAQGTDPIAIVFMGQGPLKLPSRPWLVDLGFVNEEVKRDVLAGGMALVNLSRNESLSIVALEAWALGVPVIVDAACAVLVDQVKKAQGGVCVRSTKEFVEAVNEWRKKSVIAVRLGQAGKQFVRQEYASTERYAERLVEVVQSLQRPLQAIAMEQGIRRSGGYSPDAWQERLSVILDQVSVAPITTARPNVAIEPLQKTLVFPVGTSSGTITLRLSNQGDTILAAHGPARASIVIKVATRAGKRLSQSTIRLPSILMPGQETLLVASIELPSMEGQYRSQIRLKQGRRVISRQRIKIIVAREAQQSGLGQHSLGPLLQSARSALSQAKKLESLPEDYVDVSEGRLAGIKRSLKRKLLNNFRKAYVDVAFRQQSALNEKLIAVMSLLIETVSSQDSAQPLAEIQRRLDRLERAVKREKQRNRRLEQQLEQMSSPNMSLMEGA